MFFTDIEDQIKDYLKDYAVESITIYRNEIFFNFKYIKDPIRIARTPLSYIPKVSIYAYELEKEYIEFIYKLMEFLGEKFKEGKNNG